MNGVQPYFDNLNNISGPDTQWSCVNASEAFPGVQTPLSWDFWELTGERAKRGSYIDMGLLSETEAAEPADISDRVWAIFYGRVALSIDFSRNLHSRASRAQAAAFDRQIYGVTESLPQSDEPDVKTAFAAEAERKSAAHEQVLIAYWRDNADAIHQWWKEKISPSALANTEALGKLWIEAQGKFEEASRAHCGTSGIAIRSYGELRALCERVGKPDLETRLLAGLGDTHDAQLMNDLWAVAHGETTLEAFVAEHGYNGAASSALHSRVWREDPAALRPLIERYAGLGEADSPSAVSRRKGADRRAAEAELFAAVPAAEYETARALLDRAWTFTRLRELGKVIYMHAVDVGRAAARARGADLARRGLLDEPEDIFFLTRPEVMETIRPDIREIVAFRRARFSEYRALDIPGYWTGNPIPTVSSDIEIGTSVSGLGVSPGRTEGVVRVVHDPMESEPLEPGEILVCHTTDPSWGPFFFVAGGLVIDIGGAMSHGAIIAREIGVPCVINTRVGTKCFKTGDHVIVDGDNGVVQLASHTQ